MKNKSVVTEANEIQIAIELINLGARLQVLQSETKVSRERLLKLYKEVKGVSPPKGMLPFSTDWFMTWQPNVHASLFMAYFRFLDRNTKLEGLELIIKKMPPGTGRTLVQALYLVLPDLENFNFKDFVGNPQPVEAGHVFFSVVYCGIYSGLLIALTLIVYRKKDF